MIFCRHRTKRLSFLIVLVFLLYLLVNSRTRINQDTYDLLYKTGEFYEFKVNMHSTDAKIKNNVSDIVERYNLNKDQYKACPNVYLPSNNNITWIKDTYQKFSMKFGEYPANDIYGMKFYFDDRFVKETNQRYVRGIVTIHGPGKYNNDKESEAVLKWIWAMMAGPWVVNLWYKEFRGPIAVQCKCHGAGGLIRNVSNTYYYQQIITCVIPEIELLPVNASIVHKQCVPVTTNFEIVYPEEASPGSHEIGVCMASFFGKMSTDNVAYFANWMEALALLGVNEVSINNGSLQFADDMIVRAFKYYQSEGRLTFTHFPPVHEKWNSPDEDDAATEAVNKLTTGDCIYRNIKKYWYTLIIDMDELPVPVYFNKYQDFILNYTNRFPDLKDAHCLAVRTSFFYLDQKPGNPEYGSHLPMLRLTNRFRVEPMGVDGVGLSKSFHQTRLLVAAGHHLTRGDNSGKTSDLVHHFTTPEDILIHHYRKECKYASFCKNSWNQTIHDDSLVQKFGDVLPGRVETVLKNIGYEF